MGHTTPSLAEHHADTSPLAYHRRTAHGLQRYARGPETLDWDLQPNPFRRYEGCARVPLLHVDAALQREEALARLISRPFTRCGTRGETSDGPAPAHLDALGVLLELALGITAWKVLAGDRWAVRANPSSGNLHPVEAYVICSNVQGLRDGVYHYCPLEHVLELRATPCEAATANGETELWLLLSTIPWRESWKYGERAFRYCQLDVGHAIACAGVAAATMNWHLHELDLPWQQLQALAGLDRRTDFPKTRRSETEWEEAEVALKLVPHRPEERPTPSAALLRWARHTELLEFFGKANVIDPHPIYSWPAVLEVASLTRSNGETPADGARLARDGSLGVIHWSGDEGQRPHDAALPAHQLIRQRRSAQRFDGKTVLRRQAFERSMASICSLEGQNAADDLEVVLWVHRVEGLCSGVYVLGRQSQPLRVERTLCAMHRASRVETVLPLRLWLLAPMKPNVLGAQARTLHCHQDIAAQSCLTLGLFSDLATLGEQPGSAYRQLLRHAGRVVHQLYLGAELEGMRGTGIGCFFDEAVAEFLGLSATTCRSVYHFCMGKALDDPRVEVGRAYGEG